MNLCRVFFCPFSFSFFFYFTQGYFHLFISELNYRSKWTNKIQSEQAFVLPAAVNRHVRVFTAEPEESSQ